MLAVYVAAFVVAVPLIVVHITRKWKKSDNEIKVEQDTLGLFNQIMFPDMEVKNVIEIISGARK